MVLHTVNGSGGRGGVWDETGPQAGAEGESRRADFWGERRQSHVCARTGLESGKNETNIREASEAIDTLGSPVTTT